MSNKSQSIPVRKQIQIGDILLSYLEKNEASFNTIFFVHGNSGSAQSWYGQFTDGQFDNYRLIAVDLPAHGFSDADQESRYGVLDLAAFMVQVIDRFVKSGPYILVGFSLGANVVGEMLAQPIKPAGVVIISSSLVGDSSNLGNIFRPGVDPSVLFNHDSAEEEIREFFKTAQHNSIPANLEMLIDDYRKVAPPFRSKLTSEAMQGRISNELALLREHNVPVLIIFGKNERIVDPNYLDDADIPKWRNTIFKIDDAGHFLHLDQAEKVNELLFEYATETFKDGRV